VLRDWLHNYTVRLGRPEDVARVTVFLASPLSSYITGANYRVDGGSTAASTKGVSVVEGVSQVMLGWKTRIVR
jgi:hypothetical protein